MFSSVFNDAFLNDPFLSTQSPFLVTPFPRLLGNTGNTGNRDSSALSGSNTSLQTFNQQNDQHQWMNWNNLLQDPLQLSLNDKGNSYELMTRAPSGLRKKDLRLEVHDNVLTISGEREKHRKTKSINEERTEWVSFSRSVLLPNDIDAQNIAARYDDKQDLMVELPKKPGSGARRIEIQGSQALDYKGQQALQSGLETGGKHIESDNMQVDKEQDATAGSMKKEPESRSQTRRVPISK